MKFNKLLKSLYRLNTMVEKYEKEQERFRREERLILSAMYEVRLKSIQLLALFKEIINYCYYCC